MSESDGGDTGREAPSSGDPSGGAPSPGDWASRTEARLLDAAVRLAPLTGWNRLLVERACGEIGLSAADGELLVPNGARDLAALYSRACDATAAEALSAFDPATLKIRERIAAGVHARLEAAAVEAEAARRWSGFLAMPQNAALGLRLAWESADAIWRWAGDTATDENHYSKRAILAGILISALSVRLSQGRDEAERFVAARIENVMAFEKWKATQTFSPAAFAEQAASLLGRLRYRA